MASRKGVFYAAMMLSKGLVVKNYYGQPVSADAVNLEIGRVGIIQVFSTKAAARKVYGRKVQFTYIRESLPDEAMLAVLVEEVGECARWLNERNLGTKVELEDYYHELVQVAAMACKAWCVAKARHDIQTKAEPQAAIKEAK